MIPKILHCCWLGGGPKDRLSRACRASWVRFAPDWKTVEWDLDAVARTGVAPPPYVREALARKKWAFAADWVRMLALALEGGVYFDFDFELVKPIDDLLKEGPFVAGQWMPDGSIGPEPAILALEKGSPVAKAMLDFYESASFDARVTVGEILSSVLRDSPHALRVLPPEVFSPIDPKGVCHRTEATRGIHRYAMGWAGPKRRLARWLSWHGFRPLVDFLIRQR